MKTKIWVITTLAIFIVAIGFATETPKMNIVPVKAEKALVTFNSEIPVTFEITITKNDGEIVDYKKSKNPVDVYQKVFDFSEIGTGNYNVSLNHGNCSMNRDLHVSKKDIKVGPVVQLQEPYFCYKNGMLNVSFLNLAQNSVYLNVYKNGDHVDGVSLGKELSIQKCFDLSKLKNGNYKIVVTDKFNDHQFMVHKSSI